MTRRYIIKLNVDKYYTGYNTSTDNKNNAVLLTIKDAYNTVKASMFVDSVVESAT